MNESPIIFSAESVRAILDHRKTQTRRVIKPTAKLKDVGAFGFLWNYDGEPSDNDSIRDYCPYGKTGDRLWVRETWAISGFSANVANQNRLQVAYKVRKPEPHSHPDGMTHALEWRSVNYETWKKYTQGNYQWRRSIHMPRWASRITLEVVNVRVELLKDISAADLEAEGFPVGQPQPHGHYIDYWNALNAKCGYPWKSNPWVWVIEFKVI